MMHKKITFFKVSYFSQILFRTEKCLVLIKNSHFFKYSLNRENYYYYFLLE